MQSVRLYEMPPCRMVSSGVGMFGQEVFDCFDRWLSSLPRGLFPQDFLCSEEGGLQWLVLYREDMEVPDEFPVIPFPGGFYAVATDVDQKTDTAALNREIDAFLAANGLERDLSRRELGNVITSPALREILGYDQMDYYVPVFAKPQR